MEKNGRVSPFGGLGYNSPCAPVAQLDRAPGYEPGGHEFESCRARHFAGNLKKMEDDICKRMQKTLDALNADLAKIRGGRAHAGLLDDIVVNCYGAEMPLSQTASVSAADARTLVVSPWDANNAAAIEKAIRDSDLGLNPAASSGGIRVSFPALSEERRRDLVKVISREAETARIALRNIRRDAVAAVKSGVKAGEYSEDEGRRMENKIQKTTDESVAAADAMTEQKKQEILSV